MVPVDTWNDMSEAEKFNAADAWNLVDVLYADYIAMVEAGCASADARHSQYEAYRRAWDTAKALAPMGMTWASRGDADAG
jgi:hypothetical protein